MSPALFSDVLFTLARRFPRLPLVVLRAVPLRIIHGLRAIAFRQTVRRARRSAFYREAFARAGVDRASRWRPQDLGGFFLTADTVRRQPEALLCGEPELAIESSGTSGRVTRVYLSRRELEYSARQGGLLLALYGLGPGDRLLCTLDLAWGLGALLVERGVRYTPLFAMVPGRIDPLEAYRRLAEYRFNVLVSDPFWLARLTEIARELGRPGRMKLLMGGGEGITEQARAELERFWEAPVRMTYASTEAATVLGFECIEATGYHVNELDFFVEIAEPDGEGYGEVVITTVSREVMPFIRYRTGDVARWLPGPCRCGLSMPRISPLRGRLDEQVSCAWGNVHPDFFTPVLAPIAGSIGDWQVALRERELKPVFQFRVELDGGSEEREQAAQAVLRALERLHPEAWHAWRQRLVDVEFSFFRPGTLRHQRKLLRVVDERGVAAPLWLDHAVGAVRPE